MKPYFLQSLKNVELSIFIVCALGLFTDGYDLYIASIAEPFIKFMYQPSPLLLGIIQASALIGAGLGALVMGYCSDLLGRKTMLIYNLVALAVFAILSAFAWNTTTIIICRMLVGVAIGADYPICAAYLAEMLPSDKVGLSMAYIMFLNCLAAPIGVFAAYIIFKLYPDQNAWRWILASGAIPALISLILRAKLSESIPWLSQKRLVEAGEVEEHALKTNYKRIFCPKHFKSSFCLCACWFFMDISYYSIFLFTPFLLRYLNLVDTDHFLLSASGMIRNTLFLNSFVVIGAIAGIIYIKKYQPIKLQIYGFILAFAGILLMISGYDLVQGHNIYIIFMGFVAYNFFINAGPGITTFLLPMQYYPTYIRGTGHGIATFFGKVGAVSGTALLPYMHAYFGTEITMVTLATCLMLGALLTIRMKHYL